MGQHGKLIDFRLTARRDAKTAPQVDDRRMFQLARYQLAGFFYRMSYDEDAQAGKYWPSSFMPVEALRKQDWGNPLITSFASSTDGWLFRFGGTPTANGYFQALIKRLPDDILWSWALEWNKTTRFFGFFGDEKLGTEIISTLERPKMNPPIIDGEATYRARIENPLGKNSEDLFFNFNDPGL